MYNVVRGVVIKMVDVKFTCIMFEESLRMEVEGIIDEMGVSKRSYAI